MQAMNLWFNHVETAWLSLRAWVRARKQRNAVKEGLADNLVLSDAVELLESATNLAERIGMGFARPWFSALLAEIYGMQGKTRDGLAVLERAMDGMKSSGECWWQAELQRLNGELLRTGGAVKEEVKVWFERAVETANSQGANSLKLRATLNLSELLNDEGKHDEARTLLEEAVNCFGERCDTPDLKRARALLDLIAMELQPDLSN
jgi:adenylate cyclase